MTFPHTAANLSIVFSYTGLQDLNDESWGLDNVTVATDPNLTTPVPTPVPEPTTLLLLGSGLAGAAIFGRKRLARKQS